MNRSIGLLAVLMLLFAGVTDSALAKKKKAKDKPEEEKTKKEETLSAKNFGALKPRLIGPALTEGRISDLVVHPENEAIWYIAVASGGVWRTDNAGTTWTPIFDGQSSYSTGCITIDPNNHDVVWVGSGENNSQRSVGYGDGVYKSIDGGKSWKNMGLKDSQHIGKIMVDPRDSNVVYVAAQGPLWSAGGDRGLYKTTDGGQNWEKVLEVDEHTGVSDLLMDPRNPDVLYASSYQRRRHVWTLINGGPGSAIHKSEDGGKTWRKLKSGLPSGEVGRIGLAMAPSKPDTLYAIVELPESKGGFYRSTNGGETWSKQSSYVSGSPQYYQEIVVDPHDPDVIYSNDTYLKRSEDGGKTFTNAGEKSKHVDNHVTWIDPRRTDHLLVGCDGGLYESFDRAETWLFRGNLPIVQFYKVAADNAWPVYNVYGGTQDNFSLGGPSRTLNQNGIRNSDWFVTHGGDGFESAVDPKDPNIVYAQSQYGFLVRYDRQNGEEIDIQPQPGAGEPALRYNWDAPLVISAHDHKRLYFAANILFRSDDQGNSWQALGGDLTRQLDRNTLKVMGRVWGVDTVAKNRSTSQYGNIVALSESPVDENFLAIGTDDGLVQITEDGGVNWTKYDAFPGVPDRTYVNFLQHSSHNGDRIYAGFNNHKMGDFKPYLLRSDDRGKTWTAISANLPERGSVYDMVEDHQDPNLLFLGTEFGLFGSVDVGGNWMPMKAGLPTIAVRDLEIQKRENDLIIGTFGRSIYILDDYSPLRGLTLEKAGETAIFPVKDAYSYIQQNPLGGRGKGFLGETLFLGDNPPYGAVITYNLGESLTTRKKARQKEEGKIAKDGGDVAYPDWDTLRLEDREHKPAMILTIKDETGAVVRRLTGPTSKGMHRVAWDLRHPSSSPISLGGGGRRFGGPPSGHLAKPGKYTVSLAKWHDGKVEEIPGSQTFEVKAMTQNSIATDRDALAQFQAEVARVGRVIQGAQRWAGEAETRLKHIEKAILNTPNADAKLAEKVFELTNRLEDINIAFGGDSTISRRQEPTPPSISSRLGLIYYGSRRSTSKPTQTQRDSLAIAVADFDKAMADLKKLIQEDLVQLEEQLEKAGAPWTPGRVPEWKKQ